MQLLQRYKYESILAIILVAFLALRWEYLFAPYFWDELSYYAKSALYLNDNNLSLLPSGLPPDLSRGHPLLFQLLGGVWFRLFGTRLCIGHSLPLLISISTLIVLFKLVKYIISSSYGIVTALLLAIQPVFFAQSTFILPEITLALFTMLTLYFYLKEKLLLSIIFSIILILTKETAIIIPFAIFIYDFYIYKSIKKSSRILIPLFVLISFFILQRIQNGWFLFPFHVEIISFKSLDVFMNIAKSIYFIFVAQGRFVLLIPFVIQIYMLFKNKIEEKEKVVTILFLLVIILSILLISSLYLMNRYYLFILPLWLIICTLGIKNAIKMNKKYALILFFILLPIFFIQSQNTFNMGVDLGSSNCISATQKLANKLSSDKSFYNKNIYCHFSIVRAFGDFRLGYINHKLNSTISEYKNKNVDFAIEINPDGWERDLSYWSEFSIVETIKEGNFEIIIYKRINPI